ncbi:MAG: hypothetical protein KAX49_01385 [Halanaerobiales bacterium]|nr:hypothetical protein [Halanaerobiales bacterium]
MVKKVSIFISNQDIDEIYDWYNMCKSSLLNYKKYIKNCIESQTNVPNKFLIMSLNEIEEYFQDLHEETELAASFNMLANVEGCLRLDFFNRVYAKKKDSLSKDFFQIYKIKNKNIQLDEDILEKWKEHFPQLKSFISDYKSALKYRHWLAHGRYWVPKLGK